jgi:hypothetical protein
LIDTDAMERWLVAGPDWIIAHFALDTSPVSPAGNDAFFEDFVQDSLMECFLLARGGWRRTEAVCAGRFAPRE